MNNYCLNGKIMFSIKKYVKEQQNNIAWNS